MISRVIYKNQPKEATFKTLVQDFYRENPKVDVATISITEGKPKRSAAQNRLYWHWVGTYLAKEIGYSKDEMSLLLRSKFLKKQELLTQEGETISQGPSTTELNVEEFVDFLWEINMFAAEFGITLPHSGDFDRAMYGKE